MGGTRLGDFVTKIRYSRRLTALFFVGLMVFGAFAPTGTALALESQIKTSAAGTPNDPKNHIPQDVKQKMATLKPNDSSKLAQNFPGSTTAIQTKNKLASDVVLPDQAKSILGISNQSTSLSSAAGIVSPSKPQALQPGEILQEKTRNSMTIRRNDGKTVVKQFSTPQFYKDNGAWKDINLKLKEDTNAGDAGTSLGQAWGVIGSAFRTDKTYIVSGNEWQARFAPSGGKTAMVRLKIGDKQMGFNPVGAKSGVDPVVITDKYGVQTINFYDLWPGVNVEYVVKADELKENIILKDKSATRDFKFDVTGAGLKKAAIDNKVIAPSYVVTGELSDDFVIAPFGVVLNDFGPEDAGSALQHSFNDGKLQVSLTKEYISSLPDNAFPLSLDPTVVRRSAFGTRPSGNYTSFKSDGYVCPYNICNPLAGSVLDSQGVWRRWRSVVYADFSMAKGKQIDSAKWHLQQRLGISTSGTTAGKWIYVNRANCNGYECKGDYLGGTVMGTQGDIDVTGYYQQRNNAQDYGFGILFSGEEVNATTYKNLDPGNSLENPDGTYLEMVITDVLPMPTIVSPVDGQVYVDPQVSFMATGDLRNPSSNNVLQYQFCVSTGPGCGGAIMVSARQSSNQWTIPDGLLQDGLTYYVQARSYDPNIAVESAYGAPNKFKIDARTGKDSTQAYDTLGPVSVDLATGNMTTSAASHSSAALGGSLGISLDYNSPLKSRRGLVGQYWDVPQNYSGGIPTGPAKMTRVDQTVDFNWANGSPGGGVGNDWFYGLWTGYLTVPVTGSYTFGGSIDDNAAIIINGQTVFNTGCNNGLCYGTPITLTAGQPVSIEVRYLEGTVTAYNRVFVKGPVSEQVLPTDWLQTGVRPTKQTNGLTGRYYRDPDGTRSFTGQNVSLMMQRTDPVISFDWGNDAAVPGSVSDQDKWLVRWTGFVTAPAEGDYQFGADADNGKRITINNNATPQLDDWTDTVGTGWTSSVHLQANTPTPITVEYFENMGAARMNLMVKGTNTSEQIVPSSWLTEGASILPAGWSLGIDADGNVSYDRMRLTATGAILTDSTGSTHEYIWKADTRAYKPPVNEDGVLVRNDNGTHTLQDSDGRIYVFRVDGLLDSVTSPSDATKPTALKYTYGGTPSRITEITDGVTANRWARVYYYSSVASENGNCPVALTSFQAPTAAANKLCAVKTNDGRMTSFYYNSDGTLGSIRQPGNDNTDYIYDTLGRIAAIRDAAANDAISAGVRANDTTVRTDISYDDLGRVKSVKQPAATANATRIEHTLDYKATMVDLYRYNSGPDHTLTTGQLETSGYHIEGNGVNGITMGTIFTNPTAGTSPIYRCRIGGDSFTSMDINCENQTVIGLLGYIYNNAPADYRSWGIYRCMVNGTNEHFDSLNSDCEGHIVEFRIGYALAPNSLKGQTLQRVVGAAEPLGYGRQVQYDALYRTVRDSDVAGLTDKTEWDQFKDLVLSTTDETGLKSTTIYDDEDRPISAYGPAPTAWYGTDRLPTSNYTAQVPRTDTAYDEGIQGLAFNYYEFKTDGNTLFGAPKQVSSNLVGAATGTVSRNFGTSTPVTGYNNWGFRATGKLRPVTAGTWKFRIESDDGIRLYVNDVLQYEDWYSGPTRSRESNLNLAANSVNNFRLEYFHTNDVNNTDNANITMYVTPPGGTETATNVTQWFKPDYSLATTETVYDAQLGNVVTKTNYGSQPELGLAQSKTLDPTGLNYSSTLGYEAQSTPGSLLRQTSKTLPAGNTTNYAYYGATETADNPCTTNVTEAFLQAGMLKLKTEQDPDGAGSQTPRTTQTIYDDAGRVVATRYNSDAWTCTTYDDRGRVVTTVIPANNGAAARTITNTWAVNGNPMVTASTDTNGTITTTVDLLGRTISYQDIYSDTTTTSYDSLGRIGSETSPRGTITYTYDNYGRLLNQKIDNVVFAMPSYDTYGRLTSVGYPQAGQLKLSTITYDALGRQSGLTYTMGDGTTTVADSVNRSQSGQITGGMENGVSKSYSYDKADRLTSATIGAYKFDYGYTAPDNAYGAASLTAYKNSNITTTDTTYSGATTRHKYLYDNADRLVNSTDKNIETPIYDAHGNTTRLGSTWNGGTHVTEFKYDSSDRNTEISQNWGAQKVEYDRDVSNRVTKRWLSQNGTTLDGAFYNYTGEGDSPDYLRNPNWYIIEKYFSLPGGVILTTRDGESQTANKKVYSLPNIHGDVMRTANAVGGKVTDFFYSPFGQMLEFGYNNLVTPNTPTVGQPQNSYTYTSFSWVGKNQKFDESSFVLNPIQMGARVYIPGLGRFLQQDPIEGGAENSYGYPTDPVSTFDLSGQWPSFKTIAKGVTAVATVGSFIPGPIGIVSSAVAVAGNAAQGNWAGAATAAVGLIGGGVVGKLATNTKVMKAIVGAQSKLPVVGAKSVLFGMGGSTRVAGMKVPTLGNAVLPRITKSHVRIGWHSGNKHMLSFALRSGQRHNVPKYELFTNLNKNTVKRKY